MEDKFVGCNPPPILLMVVDEDAPNCPLITGLRPCMCGDLPRCSVCNYTKHDAQFEMDHDRCEGIIPDEINNLD